MPYLSVTTPDEEVALGPRESLPRTLLNRYDRRRGKGSVTHPLDYWRVQNIFSWTKVAPHLRAISSLNGLHGMKVIPRCSACPFEYDSSRCTPLGDATIREDEAPPSRSECAAERETPPSPKDFETTPSTSPRAWLLKCVLRKERASPYNLRRGETRGLSDNSTPPRGLPLVWSTPHRLRQLGLHAVRFVQRKLWRVEILLLQVRVCLPFRHFFEPVAFDEG